LSKRTPEKSTGEKVREGGEGQPGVRGTGEGTAGVEKRDACTVSKDLEKRKREVRKKSSLKKQNEELRGKKRN
jgi:hypothetical protein